MVQWLGLTIEKECSPLTGGSLTRIHITRNGWPYPIYSVYFDHGTHTYIHTYIYNTYLTSEWTIRWLLSTVFPTYMFFWNLKLRDPFSLKVILGTAKKCTSKQMPKPMLENHFPDLIFMVWPQLGFAELILILASVTILADESLRYWYFWSSRPKEEYHYWCLGCLCSLRWPAPHHFTLPKPRSRGPVHRRIAAFSND